MLSGIVPQPKRSHPSAGLCRCGQKIKVVSHRCDCTLIFFVRSEPLVVELLCVWAFRPELEALLRGAPGRFAPADLGVAATPEGCAVPFHRADTPMRNSHGAAYARGRLAVVD